MDFWILGQVAAGCGNRRVQFRYGMQCALLAALIAAEGRILSVTCLIDELWGEEPPDSVDNALQAHASRLRRKLQALEPERARPRLVSQTGGYRLDLDGARVDAVAFTQALAEVRVRPDLSPAEVANRLRPALALWRGPVFGGAAVGLAAQAALARLEAAQMTALELLYDSELQQGQHQHIVPELAALVRSESLNERLCEQLMVALYRCGRQADALTIYQRMRNRMAEELGIDPSPMLRSRERAILSHDPALRLRPDELSLPGPKG